MNHCLDLDRLTPIKKPDHKPNGYQRWENLLFVHWTLPIEMIRPLVPEPLELDPWDGQICVGLVPFWMKDIRLSFFPKWAGFNFLETNVRTYVHYRGEPGVYFFSLEASSWLAVQAARIGWNLPYHFANMNGQIDESNVHYQTIRKSDGAKLNTHYQIGLPIPKSEPDSLEFFLLERYLLFTVKNGTVSKGQVHHTPYPAYHAKLLSFEEDLLAAAQINRPNIEPFSVLYSPGVNVEVFGPWKQLP